METGRGGGRTCGGMKWCDEWGGGDGRGGIGLIAFDADDGAAQRHGFGDFGLGRSCLPFSCGEAGERFGEAALEHEPDGGQRTARGAADHWCEGVGEKALEAIGLGERDGEGGGVVPFEEHGELGGEHAGVRGGFARGHAVAHGFEERFEPAEAWCGEGVWLGGNGARVKCHHIYSTRKVPFVNVAGENIGLLSL